MAGFSAATQQTIAWAAASSTTTATAAAIATAQCTTGRWLIATVATRVASGSAPTVDGSGVAFSGGTLTTSTPVLLANYTAGSGLAQVEVWVAEITADASSTVNFTGTLTGTAATRYGSVSVWSGFPTAFVAQSSANATNTSGATAWNFGSVTGAADDMLLGVGMLAANPGTVTWGASYSGSVGTGGTLAYRVLSGSVTTDGEYTGTNSRTNDASMHLVLREGTGGAAYELTTDAGSYALAGSAATLLSGRVLPTDAGTYAVTGADASTLYGRVVSADPGAYAVTGSDATTLYGRVVSADPGAYVVTGSANTPAFGRVPTADISAGTWTPSTGTDLYAMVNDAGDGTYIRSSSGAASDTCEVDFPSMGTPAAGDVIISVRHRATP